MYKTATDTLLYAYINNDSDWNLIERYFEGEEYLDTYIILTYALTIKELKNFGFSRYFTDLIQYAYDNNHELIRCVYAN